MAFPLLTRLLSCSVLQLSAALEEGEGTEGAAKVMEKLEGEWRHLQRMRQRYAAGSALAAAAVAAEAMTAGGEGTRGEPTLMESATVSDGLQ